LNSLLITGADGQLGQEFRRIAGQDRSFEWIFTDRRELDISDRESVKRLFGSRRIDYCINCAAYTAVDKAESDPDAARLINVKGVAHLAEACSAAGIPLVHFSSDYVYNGRQCTPFREDDSTGPISLYALTKLEGEQAAQAIHSPTMIIRTSWLYSSFGHNFVHTMLRLGKERGEVRVVYDQIGSPTYACDLAETVHRILSRVVNGSNQMSDLEGIYNYSNEGVASWYDLAVAVLEIAGIDCRVIPIETKDFPTPARRPHFSLLHKEKIKTTFKLDIPYWREALERCLRDMKD
jgi:dTDP-4-dehydrorhamnose reductase